MTYFFRHFSIEYRYCERKKLLELSSTTSVEILKDKQSVLMHKSVFGCN